MHVKDNLDVILLPSVAMDGGALDQLGFEVIWSEAVQTFAYYSDV